MHPGEARRRTESGMDSRWLMTLQVAVMGAQKIGAVPLGTRVIAPIASGHFEGPRLRGRVLPGGGGWTLLRGDGVLELDLRLTLETDDGALIYMTWFGLRHGPPGVIEMGALRAAPDKRANARPHGLKNGAWARRIREHPSHLHGVYHPRTTRLARSRAPRGRIVFHALRLSPWRPDGRVIASRRPH